jgi:hypothetical protein
MIAAGFAAVADLRTQAPTMKAEGLVFAFAFVF